MNWIVTGIFIFIGFIFLAGIRVVRPTERGLIERLGKYNRFASAGFSYVIPMFERMVRVNITETMVDAEPQEIITNDNLNARVDAQVYFRVKPDEESVKNSQYNVNDVELQIVSLARTTLRNIIGTLTLKSANSERDRINKELMSTLIKETKNWGIDVVRTELKEIDPPKDVQETMNKVVKAENEKIAAVDFATARETEADGIKRAEIKKAEGDKQARVLRAEGEAKAFELINKSFTGNAQLLKRLEVTENSLAKGTKYIIDADKDISLVMSDIAGITPVRDMRSKNEIIN